MPAKLLEGRDGIIGAVVALVVGIIGFTFGYGVLSSRLDDLKADVAHLQGERGSETRVIVDQHERRLIANENRLERLTADLGELRADVKVIRSILEAKQPTAPPK